MAGKGCVRAGCWEREADARQREMPPVTGLRGKELVGLGWLSVGKGRMELVGVAAVGCGDASMISGASGQGC